MKLILLIILTLLISPDKVQDDPVLANVSSGRIIRINNFQSEFIESRNVDIWLPEGYNQKEKYPVLYMHDGQMLFDSTITWTQQEWGVDETASEMIKRQIIDPFIVVAIWNNSQTRHSDYLPQKPFESLPLEYQDSLIQYGKRNETTMLFSGKIKSDNYLKFIVKELKPYIDENFTTLSAQENTYIAGSSMGGLISMYAICEYPKVFGAAACMSTHWPGIFTVDNNPIPNAFINYLKNNLPDPSSHKLYFDFGTETLDSLYEPFQIQVDSILVERGYSNTNWKTMKFVGDDHSENSWKNRLRIPLSFLLKTKEE